MSNLIGEFFRWCKPLNWVIFMLHIGGMWYLYTNFTTTTYWIVAIVLLPIVTKIHMWAAKQP